MRIGKKKRILFSLFMVLLLLVLTEALAFGALSVLGDGIFSPAQTQQARRALMKRPYSEDLSLQATAEVIHPYLGYVFNPETNNPRTAEHYGGRVVTEHGFIAGDELLYHRSPDRAIVGVFGGSVAFWMSVTGEEALRYELERSPELADKEIVITRIALGGYKQPQQLLALNYFLSLGAQFDHVINLDGFNEVAVGAVHVAQRQVFPTFPMHWDMRVKNVPNREEQRRIGLLAFLEGRRRQNARNFSRSPYRYSMICNLIWKWRDLSFERKLTAAHGSILDAKPDEHPFIASGPKRSYASDDEMYRELVQIWKRCSVQMARVCAANGITYHHFLQPNQYFPGSKTLTPEEKEQAFIENHPYREAVPSGYERLREAGAELVTDGIDFHDLTMIYADVEEPIYSDTCCHVNQTGNQILAAGVGRGVVDDLARRQPSTEPLRK